MEPIDVKKYVGLLGLEVEDKVSKIKGIVTSIGFDLYGCTQVIVTPTVDKKDNKYKDGVWLDVARLNVLGKKPVMEVPKFSFDKGPENKPLWK